MTYGSNTDTESTWNAKRCCRIWQKSIGFRSWQWKSCRIISTCLWIAGRRFYISDMIKIMKGNLARQMFLAYPELKKELWGGHLWNPSYCAITVSDRSRDQVLAYIEGQKERKRKVKKPDRRNDLLEEKRCRPYPAMA